MILHINYSCRRGFFFSKGWPWKTGENKQKRKGTTWFFFNIQFLLKPTVQEHWTGFRAGDARSPQSCQHYTGASVQIYKLAHVFLCLGSKSKRIKEHRSSCKERKKDEEKKHCRQILRWRKRCGKLDKAQKLVLAEITKGFLTRNIT